MILNAPMPAKSQLLRANSLLPAAKPHTKVFPLPSSDFRLQTTGPAANEAVPAIPEPDGQVRCPHKKGCRRLHAVTALLLWRNGHSAAGSPARTYPYFFRIRHDCTRPSVSASSDTPGSGRYRRGAAPFPGAVSPPEECSWTHGCSGKCMAHPPAGRYAPP